jgi:cation:H+ antiporter
MAISNIFGSNLIMLALLLPADVLYRAGPILAAADRTATLAIASGIGVTAIYMIGLVSRSTRQFLRMGVDSLIVLALYAATLIAFRLIA